MKKTNFRSSLLLFMTAVIWGVAFVAQSAGMDYVGPFTFNAVRSLIGSVVLIPCIFLLNRGKPVNKTQSRRDLVIGGMLCGIFLAAASSFQQFGILYTSVGKAGFITALYILLVPLLGMIFGKRVSGKVWLAVGIAVVGMYLLCVTEGFTIAFGDMLVMAGALLFAVHILVIDHFSPRADGVMLSCIQFFTCGVLCSVGMMIFEQPSLSQILNARLPILYAGVMSCGVAYTCQIIGQRDTDPTIASLILSLESVVSVLAGWMLLHQSLSLRELAGCALVFCAIILAQLPEKQEQR